MGAALSTDTMDLQNTSSQVNFQPIFATMREKFDIPSHWKQLNKSFSECNTLKERVGYFLNTRPVEVMVTLGSLFINIFGIVKSIFYKYPINKLVKAFDNLRQGRKTRKSALRILFAALGVGLFLFIGSLPLPVVNLITPFIASLAIPYLSHLMIHYICFTLWGAFTGVFLTKHCIRLYEWWKFGITNYGKHHTSKAGLAMLMEENPDLDQKSVLDFEKLIHSKLSSCRILGIISPFRKTKYAFYKALMWKVRNGDSDAAGAYLKAKLAHYDAKISALQKIAMENHGYTYTYLKKYEYHYNAIFRYVTNPHLSFDQKISLTKDLVQSIELLSGGERYYFEDVFTCWRQWKLREKFVSQFFKGQGETLTSPSIPVGLRLEALN